MNSTNSMTFGNFLRRTLTAMLCIAVLVQGAPTVFALTATPASDTLSRLSVGVSANHEIVFLTPTGVDAPTDTISISLPNFTFGSVGIGDIDLFHGTVTGFENADTIAAAPAAGTWGVAIVGTTVTFTAPTDAAPGTVPSNDRVAVRIGTNATGGVNQLTNPATETNAQITIGGTFGDSNIIGVAIINSDSMSVTATVLSPTTTPPVPGSGGGGGAPILPPSISNIQVINITGTSARILWTTDVPASSVVSFGTTIAYSGGTVSDSTLTTSHMIDVYGLSPNTLYHFIVSSVSAASLSAVSSDQTFTTAGDVTPPVISNIQIIQISDTSALVIWNTDEPSTSAVSFGTTSAYDQTVTTPGMVTTHAVQLVGLSASTLYHLQVRSADQSSNVSLSGDLTFTTLADTTPPANVSGFTAVAGDGLVSLSWQNPTDPDFALVQIVRKLGGYPTGPFDGTTVYSGAGTSFTDTGLVNGETYYYAIYAVDAAGNFSSGALASATPQSGLPTPIPPPVVPIIVPPQPPALPPIVPTPIPPTTPPIVPAVTPPSPGVTQGLQVMFYGAGGTVQLSPDSAGQIGALVGSPVLVVVPVSIFGKPASSVTVDISTLPSSLYSLQPSADGTSFVGTFVIPTTNSYTALVTLRFQDGMTLQATYVINAQGVGRVVEETITGPSDVGVADTSIQLFREVDGAWVAFGPAQRTQPDGSYAYVVPNGRYYLEFTKDGYRLRRSNIITVRKNVINQMIALIREPIEQENAIANAIEQATYAAIVARDALQSPAGQEAVAKVALTAIVVSILNLVNAISLFNLLAYLRFIVTQPILLLERRRKKKWGVVFNSLSKEPIDLAIVRLVVAHTNILLQTRVTDRLGRYAFLTVPGVFKIEVVKPGHTFPTQYLQGQQTDVEYADLYHAGEIETKEHSTITSNIPMDPLTVIETPRKVIWKDFLRKLRRGIAFSAVPFVIILFILSPSVPMGVLVVAQIITYLVFRRIAVPLKAKSWGSTVDAKTKKPIRGVIVRVFDKKFNKLLETQVTQANGTYGFFVKRNVYYVTAEKQGYAKYVSPDIDLRNQDAGMIDHSITLKKDS